ncbi:LysM domain-containing protein [uncultured Microscilla sp.]|uniref:LysM peptidoglycan-binding domain-containing protein n=1 Tax=uncultured Microscilla sp. TaxID=432653 RepID=UPI003452E035
MQVITIQEGDTLTGLAVIYYGTIEGVVSLARDNNLSITSELTLGQKLLIDSKKIIKPLTAKQLQLWLDR